MCWGLNKDVFSQGGGLGIGSINPVGTTTESMGDNLVPVQFPTNVEATYATGLGATVCSTACWAGSYASSVTVCTKCVAGTYSSVLGATAAGTCLNNCTVGSYTVAGSSVCTVCAAGTFSTASSVGTCTSCAAGNYSTVSGATIASTCLNLCSVGSYSTPGSSVCALCAAGTYFTGSGTSACTLCDLGTYSTVLGASAAGTCLSCSAGSYSLTGSAFCVSCAAGTFSTASGASACTLCAGGTYSTAFEAPTAATCSACATGSYSMAGSSFCTTYGSLTTPWLTQGSTGEHICVPWTVGSTLLSFVCLGRGILGQRGDGSTSASTGFPAYLISFWSHCLSSQYGLFSLLCTLQQWEHRLLGSKCCRAAGHWQYQHYR